MKHCQCQYFFGNSLFSQRILSHLGWLVGFCGLPILWKQRIIFLFKGWCLQRLRHSQLKLSSTNTICKISGEWCRRRKDRQVKEEQEEHRIYFFLPNSVGFHSLPHNITLNNSLILLKLTVRPAKNAVSLCVSRGVLTVLNRNTSATLVLHGNAGKG